jgi:hypothetical protein
VDRYWCEDEGETKSPPTWWYSGEKQNAGKEELSERLWRARNVCVSVGVAQLLGDQVRHKDEELPAEPSSRTEAGGNEYAWTVSVRLLCCGAECGGYCFESCGVLWCGVMCWCVVW